MRLGNQYLLGPVVEVLNMSRQTEKVKNMDDYIRLATKDKQEFINKLGMLEDLEDELGNNLSGKNEDCSFKVLFEATKNGFWYQVTQKKFIYLVPDDNHSIIYDWNGGYPILQYMEVTKDFAYTIQCVYDVYFTDYKKKFWLKEDKSE